MQFTGRFTLHSVNLARAATRALDNKGFSTGKWRMLPALQVVLMAISGGTKTDERFHVASPAGKVELTITNPVLNQALERVWHDHLAGDTEYDTSMAPGPRFEVTFRLLDADEE